MAEARESRSGDDASRKCGGWNDARRWCWKGATISQEDGMIAKRWQQGRVEDLERKSSGR